MSGNIDGIQLQDYVPGRVYDVNAAFGSYLLAERAAELVVEALGKPHRLRDRANDRSAQRLRRRQ
jgi:hypothetical protein